MSCDYLLWIFQRKEIFQYLILNNDTVKYKDISIGEFQIHNNRSPSKKFRLNLKNLCELVNL